MKERRAIIVGAGLAGLSCARHLRDAGWEVSIYEASDRAGGRVRTDRLDGYLLDRGFQVYLMAYEEGRRQLDLQALRLCEFQSGAYIWYDGKLRPLFDPLREPARSIRSALTSVVGPSDKLRLFLMKRKLLSLSEEQVFEREEISSHEALAGRWGFSSKAIERFFRPFFGGIFLEPELETSSRMLEFVFRAFGRGAAALPSEGMGAIPRQMASDLSPDTIHLSTRVSRLSSGGVQLDSGTEDRAPVTVLATEAPEAARLRGEPAARPGGRGVTCLYFTADEPPIPDRALVLNGSGAGQVNNLAVLSSVCPDYAPPGRSLVSVSVLDRAGSPPEVEPGSIQQELTGWFGPTAARWRFLRQYRVPYALPDQTPPFLGTVERELRRGAGVYLCGDSLDTASINGALRSGRRAAEQVLADREG
jgi:phytoene dehydrogenase-like protein